MAAVVGDVPAQTVDTSYPASTIAGDISYEPVDSVVARVAAALVVSTAIVCGTAGIIGVDAPVSLRVVIPVVGVLVAWATFFAVYVQRQGLSPWLVVGHVAVVASFLLMQRQVVPTAVIVDGSNWTLPIASAALITAQVALRPPWGPLLGSAVIVFFVAGMLVAVPPTPAMVFGTLTFVIQLVLAVWLMSLLRRGDRVAEASLRSRMEAELAAMVEAGTRAEQRRQSRQLHDHGLTTLLMVGLGTISTGSATLREQAIRDLQVFDMLASAKSEPVKETVRLDDHLHKMVRTAKLPIEVQLDVPAIVTTTAAATCVVSSVAEALRNVARHAAVSTASVRARRVAGHNVVEVIDRGLGFDPEAVSASRRGIRESIIGRMTALGGQATVTSEPGRGTRVELRWNE
jgi:signal transduction histidine kinase